MGKSPWKDWGWFCLLWALLLIPLLQLIADPRGMTSAVEETTTDVETITGWASVRFTDPPQWFRMSIQGQTLFEKKEGVDERMDFDVAFPLDEGFAEFLLEAQWREEASRVVELEVFSDGYPGQEHHVWCRDRLDHLLVFRWDGNGGQ